MSRQPGNSYIQTVGNQNISIRRAPPRYSQRDGVEDDEDCSPRDFYPGYEVDLSHYRDTTNQRTRPRNGSETVRDLVRPPPRTRFSSEAEIERRSLGTARDRSGQENTPTSLSRRLTVENRNSRDLPQDSTQTHRSRGETSSVREMHRREDATTNIGIRDLGLLHGNNYGNTTINGGVLVQGNVQTLVVLVDAHGVRLHDPMLSRRHIPQRVLEYVEEWLENAFGNGTNSARIDEDGRSDDGASTRAEWATSTAVTVIYALQEPTEVDENTPLLLRLSRPTRFVAARGDPAPRGDGEFEPGPPRVPRSLPSRTQANLIRLSEHSRHGPVMLVVISKTADTMICLLCSDDIEQYPTESCIILVDQAKRMRRPENERRNPLLIIEVVMRLGCQLPSNTRIVPQIMLVIEAETGFKELGHIRQDDMDRIARTWIRERNRNPSTVLRHRHRSYHHR